MNAMSLQIICGVILASGFVYFVYKRKVKIQSKQLVMVAFMIVIGIILDRISFMIPIMGFPAFKISIAQLPLMLIGAFFGPAMAFFSGVIYDAISIFTNPTAFPFLGFMLNKVLIGLIVALVFSFSKKVSEKGLKNIFKIITTLFIAATIAFLWQIDAIQQGEAIIAIGANSKFLMIGLCLLIYALTLFFFELFLKKINDPKLRFFYLRWSIGIVLVEVIVQLFMTPMWLQSMYGIPFMASMLLRQIKATFMIPLNMWLGVAIYQMLSRLDSFQNMQEK